MKKRLYLITGIILIIFLGIWTFKNVNFNPNYKVGQPIDSLNHVIVYFNGAVNNVTERNLSDDGYNLGLKYQCVEFVKRYYYEHLIHKMPNSYGHAKDFFDKNLADGQLNSDRDLIQYTSPGKTKPKVDDLIIFSGTVANRYGHVAIISRVTDKEIEIIQQNPGPYAKSRETFKLMQNEEKWEIDNKRVLGWLRKE